MVCVGNLILIRSQILLMLKLDPVKSSVNIVQRLKHSAGTELTCKGYNLLTLIDEIATLFRAWPCHIQIVDKESSFPCYFAHFLNGLRDKM